MRVILCDDNPMVLRKYREELLTIAVRSKINLTIVSCDSGETLLARLQESPNQADIIYLDILLGTMNGLDVAQRLRELGCHAKIIFLTGCEEYAVQSFDSAPFHYIVKGSISPQKFADIFLRACAAVEEESGDFIAVTSNGVLHKVPSRKVLYFKVDNRIISMHCEDQVVQYYGKLDQVEARLADRGFIRTHRSYLVNCYHIQRLEAGAAVLSNQEQVPISAKNTNQVRRQMSSYLIEDRQDPLPTPCKTSPVAHKGPRP